MDKYRIEYKCFKQPKANSDLSGFDVERIYIGRAFNGLFEVTPQWGNGQQTKIIEKSVFNQYFEVISDRQN